MTVRGGTLEVMVHLSDYSWAAAYDTPQQQPSQDWGPFTEPGSHYKTLGGDSSTENVLGILCTTHVKEKKN